jgi:hypothetical protein
MDEGVLAGAAGGILVLGAGLAWVRRRRRAREALRRALWSVDPAARRAAVQVAMEGGLDAVASLFLERVQVETDRLVLDAIADAIDRTRWEPQASPHIEALRRWSMTYRAAPSPVARRARPKAARAGGPALVRERPAVVGVVVEHGNEIGHIVASVLAAVGYEVKTVLARTIYDLGGRLGWEPGAGPSRQAPAIALADWCVEVGIGLLLVPIGSVLVLLAGGQEVFAERGIRTLLPELEALQDELFSDPPGPDAGRVGLHGPFLAEALLGENGELLGSVTLELTSDLGGLVGVEPCFRPSRSPAVEAALRRTVGRRGFRGPLSVEGTWTADGQVVLRRATPGFSVAFELSEHLGSALVQQWCAALQPAGHALSPGTAELEAATLGAFHSASRRDSPAVQRLAKSLVVGPTSASSPAARPGGRLASQRLER